MIHFYINYNLSLLNEEISDRMHLWYSSNTGWTEVYGIKIIHS